MAYQIELDELIESHANPIIHRVMRQRLNLSINSYQNLGCLYEAEDIYQTAILKLVTHLGKGVRSTSGGGVSRSNGSLSNEGAIASEGNEHNHRSITGELTGYIAMIAHNVCNDYLRTRFPLRCRLKACLRNLMRNRREFAVWSFEGKYLCGFTEWTGQKESPKATILIADSERIICSAGRVSYLHFLSDVFKLCEGPVELEKIVCLAAKHEGIDEFNFVYGDTDFYSDSTMKCYEEVEVRQLLFRIWNSTSFLTPNQRIAFMFTSIDSRGESLLHRIVREEIISFDEVYSSLNMTKEEVSIIWDRLPMDAAEAATLLQTSSQMVAKWRHRAMKKLSPMFRSQK